jgi:hypothetical protein
MADMSLFPPDQVVGIFRGFSHGGLEFHADIVLPYKNDFQSIPMHGQFVLIQLASEDEAVLGRITSLASEGRLVSSSGEDFGIRAVREDREIPDDIRQDYLKYRVNIRVLGVVRRDGKTIRFVASHRRLPHVGSKVAWLGPEVLKEISGHNADGAELGFLAFGEYIYSGSDNRLRKDNWMQILHPTIISHFPIKTLVARRTFIFARAGFGKSVLNKLLFSNLYKNTPTIDKRDSKVPVGSIVFDPEGEYFWPDDKGRPGLCDVPELLDKIVVFTEKEGPSGFYQSFVAGNIRLDIRRLNPSDVISIALSPEQQNQQNVRKLRALNPQNWESLVNLIDSEGLASDLETIKEYIGLTGGQSDAEATAAKSNMNFITRLLHRRDSQFLDILLESLRDGKLCIVDVSQLRGKAAFVLAGIILKQVFDYNQKEFTKAKPNSIPTIAVIEEAQTVLSKSDDSGENPFVAWVKEGRKYDLGAVMITQQPGSISSEILSQGDNWFVFHLLSSIDLQTLKKANAHFSDDLLSSLLNEPLPGHCVFWSSATEKPYPIPIRVLSFEDATSVQDADYKKNATDTYASQVRKKYQVQLAKAIKISGKPTTDEAGGKEDEILTTGDHPLDDEEEYSEGTEMPVDAFEAYKQHAIDSLNQDESFKESFMGRGITWRGVKELLKKHLPQNMTNADKVAYDLVRPALNEIFGSGGWTTEKRPKVSGPGETTWVVKSE